MNPASLRHSPRLALAVLVAITLLLAACASTGAAAQKRCDHLRGTRVLQTAQIKVVTKHIHTIFKAGNTQLVGKQYLACVRPRGRVLKLAQSYREYSYPGKVRGQTALDGGLVFLHQSAGVFLEVQTHSGNLTGDFEDNAFRVVNVRTGFSYVYSRTRSDSKTKRPPRPARVLLNDRGQLAGVYVNTDRNGPSTYSDPRPGHAEIVVFNAHGTRRILDTAPSAQIPSASLRLSGSTVSWSHAGMTRMATIS
ncbi:MAG TPA: hypothetical protein VGN69_01755 [Solirubrobacteraceae bacterium]|jgi:hypothetical protein|nr:hypothetical protein [Solirubrobacteraceae bacterium]